MSPSSFPSFLLSQTPSHSSSHGSTPETQQAFSVTASPGEMWAKCVCECESSLIRATVYFQLKESGYEHFCFCVCVKLAVRHAVFSVFYNSCLSAYMIWPQWNRGQKPRHFNCLVCQAVQYTFLQTVVTTDSADYASSISYRHILTFSFTQNLTCQCLGLLHGEQTISSRNQLVGCKRNGQE